MNGWIFALIFQAAGAGAPGPEPTSLYESPLPPAPAGEIDRVVFARLASAGVKPALCSDAVFIRRVFLDLLGTLPTAEEVRQFLQDPDSKNKRRLLIDRLLERPEYADYWAMRWGDVLRIKAEFPVNLWPNAAQAYHRWVRSSLAANKPYDRFVRELLTSSGSNFRVGPVNFYRAVQSKTPESLAAAVALTFMGTRVESWPPDRLKGMAVFFSQVGYKPTAEWKEEIVFWDPFRSTSVPDTKAPGLDAVRSVVKASVLEPRTPPSLEPLPKAVFPDGRAIELPPDQDPRQIFADWLIDPKNPWFLRSIVNRVWAWLFGRGVIHEPDDIRPGNPPSLPGLLEVLEKEMILGKYDLKRLLRTILNSSTYQFSPLPRLQSPEAEGWFASYPIRRLEAEVLIDAINKVTGMSDFYSSPIPEPFTNIPKGEPAISIADGSITSPFLALFGRSARATGMANERDPKPLPAQWLYLLNSKEIQQKIERSTTLKALWDSGRKPREIAESLYLTLLSRPPTDEEIRKIEEYGAPAAGARPGGKSGSTRRREDWMDITWALMNSMEFLYRH